MTGKKALEELADEIKYTHNDGKTLTHYDSVRYNVIANDLDKLEKLEKIIKEIKDTYDKNHDIAMAAWYKSIGLTKLLEVFENERK